MEEQEDVILLHDIHVWTIVLGYDAFTTHVFADPNYQGDLGSLLRRLRKIASHDFGIDHITIQLEQSVEGCTEHHHVDHLAAHTRPAK